MKPASTNFRTWRRPALSGVTGSRELETNSMGKDVLTGPFSVSGRSSHLNEGGSICLISQPAQLASMPKS